MIGRIITTLLGPNQSAVVTLHDNTPLPFKTTYVYPDGTTFCVWTDTEGEAINKAMNHIKK